MNIVRQFLLGQNGQFLAISRDVESGDLLEIINWSAGEGDLIPDTPQAQSWNFHPLPSGCHCVSRTFRLGASLYTHGLLVPAKILRNYSNNAVSLITHLERQGLWRAGVEVTRQILDARQTPLHNGLVPVLRTLPLDGGREPVHAEKLRAFVETLGIRRFAILLDAVLTNEAAVFLGERLPDFLEVLLDVLPVECRKEVSFSTGLKFSLRRLFRVVGMGYCAGELQRIRNHFQIPVFAAETKPQASEPYFPPLKNRWAMLVATILEQRREVEWSEIAMTESMSSLHNLSRLARSCFRQLGLDAIYRAIRENRKNHRLEDQTYEIIRTSASSVNDAKDKLSKTLPPVCGTSPIPSLDRYLTAVTDSLHGNPVATGRVTQLYRHIMASVPESVREETSDILLKEGVRRWNHEHAACPNTSWRQVETMIDTLAGLLELGVEKDRHLPKSSLESL
ncbi:MAG: hypothetical protein Q4D98_12000 [Planctomycetia bacterium]|nr:hypothetical protein [Planctomycetia bacterium]